MACTQFGGSEMSTTQSNTSSSSDIGFTGLLTVLFVALKLTGYIAWSWWWVLSPLWIGAAVVVAFLIVGALVIWVMDR